MLVCERRGLLLHSSSCFNVFFTNKIRTTIIKSKAASHILKKFPTLEKSLNISARAVYKIIKSDLNLIKTK